MIGKTHPEERAEILRSRRKLWIRGHQVGGQVLDTCSVSSPEHGGGTNGRVSLEDPLDRAVPIDRRPGPSSNEPSAFHVIEE